MYSVIFYLFGRSLRERDKERERERERGGINFSLRTSPRKPKRGPM